MNQQNPMQPIEQMFLEGLGVVFPSKQVIRGLNHPDSSNMTAEQLVRSVTPGASCLCIYPERDKWIDFFCKRRLGMSESAEDAGTYVLNLGGEYRVIRVRYAPAGPQVLFDSGWKPLAILLEDHFFPRNV